MSIITVSQKALIPKGVETGQANFGGCGAEGTERTDYTAQAVNR